MAEMLFASRRTRTVHRRGLGGFQIAHNCLVRVIRHAESDDLVGRNVAGLVRPPAGHEGRPSKALSVEQAEKLVKAAADELPDGRPGAPGPSASVRTWSSC